MFKENIWFKSWNKTGKSGYNNRPNKHVLPALPWKKTKFHDFADWTPFTLNPQNSIPAQIGAGKSYSGGIYIQWATLLW